MKPSLNRIIELQKLLANFSRIDRMVDRRHGEKYVPENDSEHSYNLAMTAWFLASHFPHLNKDKVIKYAMAHDIIEVHSGDTYIYGDQELIDSKPRREAEALEKLKTDWPDFDELTDYIDGYAAKRDSEATFVYALDKLMPILIVYIHEGYSWKEQNVTQKMVYDHKIDKVALSPEVKNYFDQLYELLLKHPELFPSS